MPTSRTGLAGIGGVNSDYNPISMFSFIGQHVKEVPPSHICDAFVYATKIVLLHVIDRKVLNDDGPISIYKIPRKLVGKILPLVGNSFVDTGHNLASLSTLLGPFGLFRHTTIGFSQVGFFGLKESGVINFLSVRESDKRSKASVNSHRIIIGGKDGLIDLTRETDEPFTSNCPSNGASFNTPLDRTMEYGLDFANLGNAYRFFVNSIPLLREGKRVISSVTSKTWVPRVYSLLDTTKEGLKRKVNTDGDVLKDLRVDLSKFRNTLFENWERGLLVVKRQTFLFGFPTCLPLLKQMVIQPSALLKGIRQQGFLFLGGINSVLEGLSHILRSCCILTQDIRKGSQNKDKNKATNKFGGFQPKGF
jgi:hypothetical protein